MGENVDHWAELRAQMPITHKWAYFDHAAVAPLPSGTRDAMKGWAAQAALEGDTVWHQWTRQVERTRKTAADLLGASTDDVALVPNTTTGIGLVAEGFPWRTGDNVVVPENEFPSNAYPWMNLASRGVETRRVRLTDSAPTLKTLAEAVDDRTRILAISWVGYASGWKIEVGELVDWAHRRGVLVLLDAIQGLGVFPLNVSETGVDFVAADGHKWMLGPEGAGIFYLRREYLDVLRPLGVGWNSVAHAYDYGNLDLVFRNTASRYEGGSCNMAGLIAFGASLDLLTSFGLTADASPLATRVLAVTELACTRLEAIGARIISSRDNQHSSGIVAFNFAGRDLHAERKRCLDAGVALSCRGGNLRISPHAYTNDDDLDRLIDVLDH